MPCFQLATVSIPISGYIYVSLCIVVVPETTIPLSSKSYHELVKVSVQVSISLVFDWSFLTHLATVIGSIS